MPFMLSVIYYFFQPYEKILNLYLFKLFLMIDLSAG